MASIVWRFMLADSSAFIYSTEGEREELDPEIRLRVAERTGEGDGVGEVYSHDQRDRTTLRWPIVKVAEGDDALLDRAGRSTRRRGTGRLAVCVLRVGLSGV